MLPIIIRARSQSVRREKVNMNTYLAVNSTPDKEQNGCIKHMKTGV